MDLKMNAARQVVPMSEEQSSEMEKLRAENARLKAGPALRCKVGEKGGVSVYGLGRFPVTLYKEQWEKLFAARDQIEGFLATAKGLKLRDE
jgi:hypothetical protein